MRLYKKDLIRELEAENKRCAMYMGFMYQILQFTFVAIVALAVLGFGIEVEPEGRPIIFILVLPICFYVFGVMYAFNAYALALCGIREEKIHSEIFNCSDTIGDLNNDEITIVDEDTYCTIAKNVVTNRFITLISYGVPLGFYLVLPIASIYIGKIMYIDNDILPYVLIEVLPIICLVVYYVLMTVIIFGISKSHFGINDIQKIIKRNANKKSFIEVNK